MKITMKRIYSFIAAALTIISAASCVQELANGPQHQEGAVVYKAIAEGADSKAVLGTNESGRPQSMWEKGDKITIHNGERGYEFTTSSEDYSPVADFVYNGDGFSAENGVIAVYPAGNYDADIEARSVMVTIPSHQQAVENSYDRNAVPAVAYSTDNSLHFYNAGGLLKFTMNQVNVTKVRFSSNESVVTGSYYAICRSALSDGPGFHYNYIPDVPEYNINYAELYAPEGDTFHKGSTYYISAIPDTYDGFHIEFFAADGSLVFEARYNGKVHLSRASILNLGTLGKEGWDGSTDLMYVVGSYNDWRHDKNLYLFDYNGTEKFYSGVVDFNAYARWSTEFNEFKLTGGVWGVEEYSQPEETDQYVTETNVLDLVEDGGKNINAYQQYRFYHFTLDKNNSTLTKNYAFNSIGIIGSFSVWSEDVEMNYNPDTQRFWVDVDFAEDGEMKFRTDDMWDVSFGYDDKSGYLTEQGDNILYTAGQYRLYLNMNNLSAISYEFNAEAYGTEENAGQWDPWADEPQPDPVYGWALIGEFNGWNGDAMMTEVQPGQWEIKEFPLEADQQWKLRKDGSWDVNYGGPGDVEPYEIAVGQTFKATSYGKNMAVSTSGMYDIYFNENKETILVLEAGSPLPEPVRLDYVDEYGVNHGPGVEINGVVWAPVNCGYHETDYKYGKLYQWGRKYGQGYDGNFYDGDWDQDYSDVTYPEIEEGPVSFCEGQDVNSSNKFYLGEDWSDNYHSDIWNLGNEYNPIKTEYDPCPDGWRVPTISELELMYQNHSSFTTNGEQMGYWFSGSSPYSSDVPQVFLPAAGRRSYSKGKAKDRGYYGLYWSSTSDYPVTKRFRFYDDNFGTGGNCRAYGLSVRCVQDDSELRPVSSVTLNTSSLMMHPGTGRDIYASIAPSNANHQSVYWSSSNTSVATVDMNGTVTAVSPGTATITAMAGMKTATCEVTVEYPDLDGTREVTLWRGELMVDDWGSDESNFILSDGGIELLTAGAQPGDMVCFYVEPIEEYWEVQIFEGHWSHRYLTVRSGEYDLTANGGKILFPLTQEILDAAYMQQWWGGTFLLFGDNFKLTKVTLLTSSPDTPSSSYDYVDEYGINHGPGVEINGVVWAPVNCGYHETDFKWGKLYQWGRKYGQGYITPYYADKIGSIIEPGPVNILEGESMNNADVFFARLDYPDSGVSWRSLTWSKQSADNLWNVGTEENPVKTEYDPCPAGWRIPTYIEALSLESATSIWLNGWEESYNGMAGNWISDPNNTSAKSFFPAAGFFDKAGRGINRNHIATYWCSPSSGQNSFILGSSSEEEFRTGVHAKVSGLGVRCVRDASELIPVADLTLSDSELSIVPGQTHSLSATIAPSSANHQYAYWYSDNPDVAVVSQDGKVRAVAQGTAVITAIAGMHSAECVVTVTGAPVIDTETEEQFVGTWIGTMYGMFQMAQYQDVKFTVTADLEGGLIVSAGINPYFTMNGIDRATYKASVEGNQLVVYAEQPVGYDDVILLGFNHADANEATEYDNIRFALNEDGTLTQLYAFGAYTASGGGFYEIYNGGGTFAKEKNSIEDMPEIEL